MSLKILINYNFEKKTSDIPKSIEGRENGTETGRSSLGEIWNKTCLVRNMTFSEGLFQFGETVS